MSAHTLYKQCKPLRVPGVPLELRWRFINLYVAQHHRKPLGSRHVYVVERGPRRGIKSLWLVRNKWNCTATHWGGVRNLIAYIKKCYASDGLFIFTIHESGNVQRRL